MLGQNYGLTIYEPMKIATWNLERPKKSGKRNLEIIEILQDVNADILILTESNDHIKIGEAYEYHHSDVLVEPYYSFGERRTSIYSKYRAIGSHPTFRSDTSICKILETPFGNLAVYGTVIGINGNRRNDFIDDLKFHVEDFLDLSKQNNLCIAGDLNLSFGDNYYFTSQGREILQSTFNNLNLKNLTAEIPQNIDHIIIADSIVGNRSIKTETWNNDKRLSDHIGVSVEFVERPSM